MNDGIQAPTQKPDDKPESNPDIGYTREMIDTPQAEANLWQKWLFGIGVTITLGIFIVFVVVTIQQITNVQTSIDNPPVLEDSLLIKTFTSTQPSTTKETILKSLLLLENETVKKRYHNANVILKSQIYIKFLGFLTGMILSFLGAIFIFGKFREYPINTGMKGGASSSFSWQLQSTSPGIFLAFVGAIIMITTILSKADISVVDEGVYITSQLKYQSDSTKAAAPASNKTRPPHKPANFDSLLNAGQ